VVGGFGSAAILSVMAALVKYYLGSTNQAGTNALVALYFIFGAFFTSTVECTSYVYGSEIWPTHLRSEGSTLAYASFFGNAIAYSAPVSVALKNIGWEFYMILVSVTVVSAIGIAFYFPEVCGRSILCFVLLTDSFIRPWAYHWKKSITSLEMRWRLSSRTPLLLKLTELFW